jgi:hypothetical protein
MIEDAAFDQTRASLPAAFRTAVAQALTEMEYTVESWETDGVNILAPSERLGEEDRKHYVGLANLYRRVKGAEPTEWPAMIRAFLDHILGTLGGPAIPDNLATIALQLRPRLGKPFSREAQTYPWGIPLPGTGLEINLVIDYPNTMAYVTEGMLKKSRSAGDELLDFALANLRQATSDDFFEQVSVELDIYVGHTGDGYDAARALFFEDLLPESPAGFLVAIPSRDELAVWPVSYDALSKIHVIKMFAEDNYQNHAYPISDDVFWVWRGTWYHFGIQMDDQNVTVSPPDEFIEALKELAGPKSRAADES